MIAKKNIFVHTSLISKPGKIHYTLISPVRNKIKENDFPSGESGVISGFAVKNSTEKISGACAKENREAKAGSVMARLVFARFFLLNSGKAGKDADSFWFFFY